MSKYKDILAGVLKHDYYLVYLFSPGPTPGLYGPKLPMMKYGTYTGFRGFIDGAEAHTSFSKNVSDSPKSGWHDQSKASLLYAAMWGYDKEGDPHLVMQHGSLPGGVQPIVPPSQRPAKPKPQPKPEPKKPEPTRPVVVRDPVPEPAPVQSAEQVLPTPSRDDGDSGLMTGLIAGGVGLVAAIAVTRKKRRR